ncbi:hypothetical protein L1049_021254 [Liquidambar formosana]|uniref:Uncharacterized protein n=1 Tax=Liquidambar formosana TaxID=63359 RepID=A0AAP0SB55_LIQFO
MQHRFMPVTVKVIFGLDGERIPLLLTVENKAANERYWVKFNLLFSILYSNKEELPLHRSLSPHHSGEEEEYAEHLLLTCLCTWVVQFANSLFVF